MEEVSIFTSERAGTNHHFLYGFRVLRSARLVAELDRLDRCPGEELAHFGHVFQREDETALNLL